jgi:hypothetical protein
MVHLQEFVRGMEEMGVEGMNEEKSHCKNGNKSLDEEFWMMIVNIDRCG